MLVFKGGRNKASRGSWWRIPLGEKMGAGLVPCSSIMHKLHSKHHLDSGTHPIYPGEGQTAVHGMLALDVLYYDSAKMHGEALMSLRMPRPIACQLGGVRRYLRLCSVL
jgi:hypothetical protein